MIVRMRLRKWEGAFTLKQAPDMPVGITDENTVGFLEVYESLEKLHADYPGETNWREIATHNGTERA